jgi:cobalamin biosynthesis protein CobW
VEAAIAADRRAVARTVRAAHGVVPAAVLLGQSAAAEADAETRRSHHELAGEEHEHDDFASVVLPLESPSREAATQAVARAMHVDGVLRIKGHATVRGRSAALAVQAVGPRVEAWFVPDGVRRPGLVVIGLRGFDVAAVEAALAGEN